MQNHPRTGIPGNPPVSGRPVEDAPKLLHVTLRQAQGDVMVSLVSLANDNHDVANFLKLRQYSRLTTEGDISTL